MEEEESLPPDTVAEPMPEEERTEVPGTSSATEPTRRTTSSSGRRASRSAGGRANTNPDVLGTMQALIEKMTDPADVNTPRYRILVSLLPYLEKVPDEHLADVHVGMIRYLQSCAPPPPAAPESRPSTSYAAQASVAQARSYPAVSTQATQAYTTLPPLASATYGQQQTPYPPPPPPPPSYQAHAPVRQEPYPPQSQPMPAQRDKDGKGLYYDLY